MPPKITPREPIDQLASLVVFRIVSQRARAPNGTPSRWTPLRACDDRAPRFRQCLIIAPRSSTCRVQLHCKRTSSTSSAGLPKRRAADTYPCDASWPGRSWPCMSLDRYTQSTLNVARHAKKSEVEGEIESQIESQEVQEGQEHSGAGGRCHGSSRLRRQARSRRSGGKRRRGATSF